MQIRHAPPYTVAIDAGHGGPYYFGAAHSFADGSLLIEKDLNLDIALRLEALLKAAGYSTVLTRDGDGTLTAFDPSQYRASQRAELQARVDLVNAAAADILVSVHFNGSDDSSQAGTEVYYNPDRSFGPASYALASSVHDALLTAIRGLGYEPRDRGVRNDAEVGGDPTQPHSFLLGTDEGFRASLMPGIIGEALFVSNEAEAALLMRDEARQAIAAAYKAGIDAYFHWLNGG